MNGPLPITPVTISTFSCVRDNKPKPITFSSWEVFVKTLDEQKHAINIGKDTECFSPAEFLPGTTRKDENVAQINFGVLDLDQDVKEHVENFIEKLSEKGIAVFYYTSWSYIDEPGLPFKSRVIIPFTKPVNVTDWPSFWPKMLTAIGATHGYQYIGLVRVDSARKDKCGLFYLPSVHPDRAQYAEMGYLPGDALDVDKVKAIYTGGTERIVQGVAADLKARKRTTAFSIDAFKKKVRYLQQHHKDDIRTKRFLLLRDGEAFTHPDEPREPEANSMCGTLAKWFPTSDPIEMAKVFQVSLLEMDGSGLYEKHSKLTLNDIADKISRHQETESAKTEAKESQESQEQVEQRALNIMSAFESIDPGRVSPYEQAELDGFGAKFGPLYKARWIVGNQKSGFYIQIMGDYKGPFVRIDLANKAKDLLAPAYPSVDVYAFTAQGRRLKTADALIEQYGTTANDVEATFLKSQTIYDGARERLILAKAPIKHVDPVWDDKIDEWLRCMAGTQYQELCDWLAWFQDLNTTLDALYLHPAKGVGKSVLFTGLSKFWAQTPSQAASIFGTQFNEDLLRCPFVVCDDDPFPANQGGKFRNFIFASSHVISQKGVKQMTVEGCCRMAFAANSDALLRALAVGSNDETEALGERILEIKVNPKARELIENFKRADPEITKRWADYAIAEHVAYLHQYKKPEKLGRGITRRKNEDFETSMATSGTYSHSVLSWLVNYILNPNQIDKQQYSHTNTSVGIAVFKDVKRQQIAVRFNAISHLWGFGHSDDPRFKPTSAQIKMGLSPHLSDGKVNGPLKANGKRDTLIPVKTAHLVKWALDMMVCTEEELLAALMKRSEQEIEE